MNGENEAQTPMKLRDVLDDMFVAELPGIHARNFDELYNLYSSMRRRIDNQRNTAQCLYHMEVEKLSRDCEQYVFEARRRIAQTEADVAQFERITKHQTGVEREQFAECVRRHADAMRALKLWYSRELRQIEASQSSDATPIEPEMSHLTQNPE